MAYRAFFRRRIPASGKACFSMLLFLLSMGLSPAYGQNIQLVNPPTVASTQWMWQDLNNRFYSMNDVNNKVVILHLWASWCAPCLPELPKLAALQSRYADAGLEVLPIAVSDSPDKVRSVFLYNRIEDMTPYLDLDDSLNKFSGATSVPTTFIISRDGLVHVKIEGVPDWEDSSMRHIVEVLLTDGYTPKGTPLPKNPVIKDIY